MSNSSLKSINQRLILNRYSQMAYKLKNEAYRKEIRRHQLDEIFQSKRLKLMSGYSEKMEAEEPCFVKKEDLPTMNLLSIAKLSQTKSGTEILNEANYSQHIIKYLSSEYLNTVQQYYTSYILCNKSVYEKTAPPIQHLNMILQLLEEVTDQKVVECLLDTIANTISEFQMIKEDLVRKFSLADRIIAIFGCCQNPAYTLCETVLNCIIHMLHHSEPHPSFKKLRQTLVKFLSMIPKKQTQKIIKKATCSLRYLTKMYPLQLLDFLIKGKVFQRYFDLYVQMEDISFAHFTFSTVQYVLNDMKETDFRRLIIPFIESLSNSSFFIGKASKINSFTIKQEAYHLIHKALETRKIESNTFIICDLGKRMLQEFQVQESQEIRILFMDIFTTVYFEISNQQVKNSIERSMQRMRQLDQKDIRVASHIDQLSISFHH